MLRDNTVKELKAEIANALEWNWVRPENTLIHAPLVQNERYDLFFDPDGETVVAKPTETLFLKNELQRRIVVVRGTSFTPIRMTLEEFAQLVPFEGTIRRDLLMKGLEYASAFMAFRNNGDVPYYRALSYWKPFEVDVYVAGIEALQALVKVRRTIYSDEEGALTCDDLDDADRDLIQTWRLAKPVVKSGKDKARSASAKFQSLVLSYARLAEKLTLDFYRRGMDISAIDVSIQQVRSGNEADAWKTHDIFAARAIDVKNATVFHSFKRHNYVDKFKRVEGEDVLIAGVVSRPNMRLRSVTQHLLGLCSLTGLEQIQAAINGQPGRRQAITLSFYEQTLPPWAFELEIMNPDFDKLHALAMIVAWEGETVLSTGIAAGVVEHSSPYGKLKAPQRDIVDRFAAVVRAAGHTKATVYLFALSEFIDRLLQGLDPTAFVRFFRKLLSIENFSNQRVDHKRAKYEIAVKFGGSSCGGLYDPMGSILEGFRLLEKSGASIAQSDFAFASFNAANPHTLIGKTVEGRYVTIFAYCGGALPNGQWCNKFPLIIGERPSCPGCGKLICDECDFCSESCNDHYHRKVRAAQDQPQQ